MSTYTILSASRVSARKSILSVPWPNTTLRIRQGLKRFVIERARFELAEWVLTMVIWHLLCKKSVEVMKEVVFLMLPTIWICKVSRAGDVSLSPEQIELPDLVEPWRLIFCLTLNTCAMFQPIKHSMVITSPFCVHTLCSISPSAPVPDYWNLMVFKSIRVLMLQLWLW